MNRRTAQICRPKEQPSRPTQAGRPLNRNRASIRMYHQTDHRRVLRLAWLSDLGFAWGPVPVQAGGHGVALTAPALSAWLRLDRAAAFEAPHRSTDPRP